jgi:hypothetical protein
VLEVVLALGAGGRLAHLPDRGEQQAELTVAQILARADRHRRRTGRWPGRDSGRVAGAAGETWVNGKRTAKNVSGS